MLSLICSRTWYSRKQNGCTEENKLNKKSYHFLHDFSTRHPPLHYFLRRLLSLGTPPSLFFTYSPPFSLLLLFPLYIRTHVRFTSVYVKGCCSICIIFIFFFWIFFFVNRMVTTSLFLHPLLSLAKTSLVYRLALYISTKDTVSCLFAYTSPSFSIGRCESVSHDLTWGVSFPFLTVKFASFFFPLRLRLCLSVLTIFFFFFSVFEGRNKQGKN